MAKYILALVCVLFAVPAYATDATVADSGSYIVQPGNSLYRIARRAYGNADVWPELAKANNIQGPKYVIHPGDVLTVPVLSVPRTVNIPVIPIIKAFPAHTLSIAPPAPQLAEPTAPNDKPAKRLPKRLLHLLAVKPFVAAWNLMKVPGQKTVKVMVKLTGYDACSVCTEKDSADPHYGITAIGHDAFQDDGVAADPELVPFGTRLEIPGVGTRIVDDTGKAMRDQAEMGIVHFDVRFKTHEEARHFGVRWVEMDVPIREQRQE